MAASHLDLFAAAERVRAAAATDQGELHAQLQRLRTELTVHLREEAPDLRELAPPARRVVARGQRRLLRLVDEMLSATAHPGACSCLARSAELRLQLVRHARLEVGILGDRDDSSGSAGGRAG